MPTIHHAITSLLYHNVCLNGEGKEVFEKRWYYHNTFLEKNYIVKQTDIYFSQNIIFLIFNKLDSLSLPEADAKFQHWPVESTKSEETISIRKIIGISD